MKQKENKLIDIFGTIKVITIPRNIEKQSGIKEFLKDLPFEFSIDLDMTTMYTDFENVKDLPDEVFEKYELDKDYCSRWSKGQLGCFATEKKIIKDFSSKGSGNLTIFLDDAKPHKNWKSNLVKAYVALPNDWDALILGTHLQNEAKRLFRPMIHLKRLALQIFSKRHLIVTKRYNRNLDYARKQVAGIYGIIYSPSGLKKLIGEPNRMTQDQDDVLLSRLISTNYMKVFIAYPQVVFEGKYDGSWTQKNSF